MRDLARPADPRPLRVRRARDTGELDAFAAGYAAATGYRADPDLLRFARSFVAVRAKRVVGGFVLNVEPPFRTLLRVPDHQRSRLSHEFPATDTVELTCVWLAPQARTQLASAVLWSHLAWQTSRQGRARVVFGTDIDALRRIYERTGPRLLYEGEVWMDGHERHGWVYSIAASAGRGAAAPHLVEGRG